MIKILCISGKSGSGKDTIVNKLVKEHEFKKIVTYTSRPIREKEEQDVTYHFISEEEFIQKINEGFFLEYKTYNTTSGIWYYGTSIESIEFADDKSVIILTPQGVRDLKKKLPEKKLTCIYLYVNGMTAMIRTMQRGDDLNEISRRLKHDDVDFDGFENEADVIINNCDYRNFENVFREILNVVEDI